MRIRHAHIDNQKKVHQDDSPDAELLQLNSILLTNMPPHLTDWVDIEEPSEQALNILDALLGQSSGYLAGLLNSGKPGSFYLDKACIFQTQRMFYHFETDTCSGRPLLIIFMHCRLISLHPLGLSRTISHIFETVQSRGRDLLQQNTGGALFSHFIDELMEDYKPVLESWRHELDGYEQNCITSSEHNTLMEIVRFKKLVTRLRQSIHNVYREQRRFLMRCPQVYLNEKDRMAAQEAIYRFEGLLEEIESIRLHTASAYQVYAAALNLDMTRSSNRLNTVMERLAVVTSIFMPLTFIVGIYGMNIPNMPEFSMDGFYYTLWGIMIFIAATLLFIFKKLRWY